MSSKKSTPASAFATPSAKKEVENKDKEKEKKDLPPPLESVASSSSSSSSSSSNITAATTTSTSASSSSSSSSSDTTTSSSSSSKELVAFSGKQEKQEKQDHFDDKTFVLKTDDVIIPEKEARSSMTWPEFRQRYIEIGKKRFIPRNESNGLSYVPIKTNGPWSNKKGKMLIKLEGVEPIWDPFGVKENEQKMFSVANYDNARMLKSRNPLDRFAVEKKADFFFKPFGEAKCYMEAFDAHNKAGLEYAGALKDEDTQVEYPYKGIVRWTKPPKKEQASSGEKKPFESSPYCKIEMPTKIMLTEDRDAVRVFDVHPDYLDENDKPFVMCVDATTGKEISFVEFRAPLIQTEKDKEKKDSKSKSSSSTASTEPPAAPKEFYKYDLWYVVTTNRRNDRPEAERGIGPTCMMVKMIRHGPFKREVTPKGPQRAIL
jgi:hypothetical protein